MSGGQRAEEVRNLTARGIMDRIATNREAVEQRKAKAEEAAAAIKAAQDLQKLKGAQDFREEIFKAQMKIQEVQEKFGNDIYLEKLKKNLVQAKSPEELEKIQAEIAKLTAETTQLKTGKPSDNVAQQRLDIAKQQLALDIDKVTKSEMDSVAPSYINSKGAEVDVPFVERQAKAIQANQRASNPIYYQIKPPVKNPGDWFETPGDVIPIVLPKHPQTGEQMIMQQLIKMASDKQITVEQALQQMGLLK